MTRVEPKRVAAIVPYCRAHVPRVHQWKQDLELLRLLESEPRTSDDEACTAGVTRVASRGVA